MKVSHNDDLKIAIWMVTCNHELYIKRAIESVLMQKTDYTFKLFIGEDYSTDSTREICLKLRNLYPEKIELILSDKNLGADYNSERTYTKCIESGAKYIAMLEGDDYWTDLYKLQKQVDFLEHNQDYKFSMGIVETLIENTGKIIRAKEHINPASTETYLLKDYIRAPFSQTSSFLFRNMKIYFPNWKNNIHAGDQLIVILMTGKEGKIKYHNEVFSMYRLNSESITFNSNLDELRKKGDFFLNKIDELTDYSFSKLILFRKILHRIYFFTFSKYLIVRYTSKLLFIILTKISYKI
jgi:hypothetical protein